VKPVTRYQANDGTLFLTEEDAVKRDELLASIAQAMAPLGGTRDDMAAGWIQHAPINVFEAKRALLLLARPIFAVNYPNIAKAIDTDPASVHPHSGVARILSEENTPISKAWDRLGRIDDEGREHSQSYYAMHGPNPQHACLEDRR